MVDINQDEYVRGLILAKEQLDIAYRDVQSLSNEEYALVRKDFFGASDSSILCDVNLYKNMTQLIQEKRSKFLTDEEKAVGEKPIVRKGRDLEPLILQKASKELDKFIFKPIDMFKFKDVDGLSVNYDGVMVTDDDTLVPVEAKLVSKYGEKYYNKLITTAEAKQLNMDVEGESLSAHIKRKATKLGIPAYYYTQVQQEISGINAPYGYLAALFDESWTFKLFYIPRDEYVINSIKLKCENNIDKIR